MLCGPAVGPILSLPTRVLEPGTRAIGMGVFASVAYVGLVLGPSLGGKYATWAGSAGAAFDFGAVVLLTVPSSYGCFTVSRAERRSLLIVALMHGRKASLVTNKSRWRRKGD